MKKIVIRLIVLAILAGVGYGGWRLFQAMPQRQAQIATTKVRKSDVIVRTLQAGLDVERAAELTGVDL